MNLPPGYATTARDVAKPGGVSAGRVTPPDGRPNVGSGEPSALNPRTNQPLSFKIPPDAVTNFPPGRTATSHAPLPWTLPAVPKVGSSAGPGIGSTCCPSSSVATTVT